MSVSSDYDLVTDHVLCSLGGLRRSEQEATACFQKIGDILDVMREVIKINLEGV